MEFIILCEWDDDVGHSVQQIVFVELIKDGGGGGGRLFTTDERWVSSILEVLVLDDWDWEEFEGVTVCTVKFDWEETTDSA